MSLEKVIPKVKAQEEEEEEQELVDPQQQLRVRLAKLSFGATITPFLAGGMPRNRSRQTFSRGLRVL